MYSYNRIWNIADWRFLQAEAATWLAGNKVVESWFFIGSLVFLYFDNFILDNFKYSKYVGILVVIYSVSTMRYRFGLREGYIDGYEQGFIDASTRNLDYWRSESNFLLSEDLAIDAALSDIDENEKKISEKNRRARADEVQRGIAKLLGWMLTWRKIKPNDYY